MSSKPADTNKPRGLRTIVLHELGLRGIKVKDTKAPQAPPSRKASAKLEARRKAHASDPQRPHQRTAPGSYNLKKG